VEPLTLHTFLHCPTPQAWIDAALQNIDILLVDHANCEKKAAATAMNLMYRYVDQPVLLEKMSQLAREELLHFEQVVSLMRERNIPYIQLGPARYAAGLRQHVRTHEPARLVDLLVVGAFVEARSCERFAALVPHLDAGLAKYYKSLLRSEARHFEDYLMLARECDAGDIEERIAFFAGVEQQLINSADSQFRFHSGIPDAA
jgi:tRNA 2-(methylsulfanyl)-N6-isopentenyladenosine37 hydroxylase